jgi:hypothetical protein
MTDSLSYITVTVLILYYQPFTSPYKSKEMKKSEEFVMLPQQQSSILWLIKSQIFLKIGDRISYLFLNLITLTMPEIVEAKVYFVSDRLGLKIVTKLFNQPFTLARKHMKLKQAAICDNTATMMNNFLLD